MKRTHLILSAVSALILLVFVLSAAAWLWRAPLLDGFVRPRLEALLEERLDARVTIGALTLDPGELMVGDLEVVRPQALRIELPQAVVRFTLTGLLRRRLGEVILAAPRVAVTARGEMAAPPAIPPRPPLDLDRLQVRGGRFIFQAAEREFRLAGIDFQAAGSPLAFNLEAAFGNETAVPLAASGALHWQEAPEVEFRSLVWDGRSLLASPLRISPAAEGPLLAGHLTLQPLGKEDVVRWAEALGQDNPLPAALDFSLDTLNVEFSLPATGPVADLSAPGGWLAYGALRVPISSPAVHLALENGAMQGHFVLQPQEQGTLTGDFRYAASQLDAHLSWDAVHPDPLQRLLLGEVALPAAGTLQAEAEVAGPVQSPRVKVALRGRRSPTGAGDGIDLAALAAELRLWREDAWQVAGEAALAGKKIVEFKGTSERLRFAAGPLAAAELRPALPPTLLPAPLDFSGLTLSGEWQAATAKKNWSAPVTLKAARVGYADVSARGVQLTGRLEGAGEGAILHWDAVQATLAGRGGKGALHGQGRLSRREGVLSARIDRLELKNVEYTAPSGAAGFLGGRLGLHGGVTRDQAGALSCDLSGEFTPGEVLKGTFYADLSPLVTQFQLRGRGRLEPLHFEARSLRAALPGVGALEGGFSWQPARIDARLTLDLPDLASAFDDRLRPVLGESLGVLRELEPAGAFGAYLSVQQDGERTRLQGRLQPDGIDLRWPQKEVEMVGATGKIPFDLHFPPTDLPAADERRGQLEFAYLGVGPARLAPGPLRWVAGPNAFRFDSPLVFFVAGGTLSLSGLEGGWSGVGLSGGGRVAAAEIDLGRLAAERQWPPFEGSLTADLGRIGYRNDILTSEGRALIDVFGGRLTLSRIRGDKISSPYPVLTGDIDVSGIDLQRLTRTFSFGEISGVVDGYVRELRTFGLTPTHFAAAFESRSAGERSISVKAVRNLTVISQGGLSGVLSQGIYRFIDFYNYRKIGVFCSLENDVFTLRGTAVKGSDRYLVAGGLMPPKIDILAPAHRISFREMVKRISRIERAE